MAVLIVSATWMVATEDHLIWKKNLKNNQFHTFCEINYFFDQFPTKSYLKIDLTVYSTYLILSFQWNLSVWTTVYN